MDTAHINAVAAEINRVLNLAPTIIMSWGISQREAYYGKRMKMPALKFKVNGFIHRGYVVVALNEATDLYEIFLLGARRDKEGKLPMKKHITGIYCDQLVRILDKEIETADDQSDDYKNKVDVFLASI